MKNTNDAPGENFLSGGKTPFVVKLSISQFGNCVTDPTVTQEVKHEKHLGDDSGKWDQYKIRPYRLEPVEKAFRSVRDVTKFIWQPQPDGTWRQNRRAHRSPWERGYGLSNQDEVEILKIEVAQAEEEAFAVLDEHIVSKWDEIVEEAKEVHNGTFRPELYPSADAIRGKWKVKFTSQPVVSSKHLETGIKALYGDAIDQMVAEKFGQAEEKVWDQLIAPMSHLAETLVDPEKKFKDSLVDNVKAIMNAIPDLNYGNSAALNEARATLQQFTEIDPQDLRDMPMIRKQTAMRAQAVAAKFTQSKRILKIQNEGDDQ